MENNRKPDGLAGARGVSLREGRSGSKPGLQRGFDRASDLSSRGADGARD